jgi:hypothetical protein
MPEKTESLRLWIYRKKNIMNTLIKIFAIFTAIPLLISGCGSYSLQAENEEPATPNTATYEFVLGKALTDEVVANFIASNNCEPSGPFQVCKEVGMALWINLEQVVETVYLYLNNADGFAPYKGELPFGLKFYDTMGAVEYKLERQEIGNNGLPDKSGTPDHIHYWAVYKQFGMTIIYNSPFVDEDATIYAILVSR